ncbi:hypothetical protein VNO78_11292 [Psophocarpus tetragonolobus]|uniref:Uncharacterized protein n=1 Tax=Psophocarpus tetragonolobus TaxID=3891 RepID=A0AAN9SLH9_PSOTE
MPTVGTGFTGIEMARRFGAIDDYDLYVYRLGVQILVSGFLFEENFTRPWERQNDNLERCNSVGLEDSEVRQ